MRRFEYVRSTLRKYAWQAPLPQRATAQSVGYDIYSPISVVVYPHSEPVIIWTDVKAVMEPDDALIINVRSSMGKNQIMLAHTQGWIDADYYGNPDNDGNICISLINLGDRPYKIQRGDRIAQAMFQKRLLTDDDAATGERRGGLGSTGR